jgi:hypothetical protein
VIEKGGCNRSTPNIKNRREKMNRRRLATLSIFMICLLGISLGLTAPIPSARRER